MTGHRSIAASDGGLTCEPTCWAQPANSWPGLAVAATEIGDRVTRVHLIGELTQHTASILADGLARVARSDSGPESDRTVLLDLSALIGIDDAGLTALAASQESLRRQGCAVGAVWPHGPMLRLLDQAARAGWYPPELRCTDILQWRRRPRRPLRTAGVSGWSGDPR